MTEDANNPQISNQGLHQEELDNRAFGILLYIPLAKLQVLPSANLSYSASGIPSYIHC